MTYIYQNGLGDAAAYQVSGQPFLSGNIEAPDPDAGTSTVITFPYVTSWVQITNHDKNSALRVGLNFNDVVPTALSVNDENIIIIPVGTSTDRLYLKITQLHFVAHVSGETVLPFEIMAGLTSVRTTSIPNNWSGSAGG